MALRKFPVLPPRRDLAFRAFLVLFLSVGFCVLLVLLAAGLVFVQVALILFFELVQTVLDGGNGETVNKTVLVSIVLLFDLLIFVPFLSVLLLASRRPHTQPSALLERASHPALFREIDGIAAVLSVPPPQWIYLVPVVGAEVTTPTGLISVFSRRVMRIGLPLLSILTVSQFRAVLAHEFAHFYSGDTRLGPLVCKTRKRIEMLAGVSEWLRSGNVERLGASLIEGYTALFQGIINRLSDQQERRADELACQIAGSQAFAEGLLRIHAASDAFAPFWNDYILPILRTGYHPPIADGFVRYLQVPHASRDDLLAKEASWTDSVSNSSPSSSSTSVDDWHPPISDRIKAALALNLQTDTQNGDPAITLLDDLQAAELQLLRVIEPHLRVVPPKSVSWSDVGDVVILPLWKRRVGRNSGLLIGLSAGDLPDALHRRREIAAQMPSPKGTLLTVDQRVKEARELMAMALGLALLKRGWRMKCGPGQLYFQYGEISLNPIRTIDGISSGNLPGPKWLAYCCALNILDLPLADSATFEGCAT